MAYVANRLAPLDTHNKLLPASDSANITDYAGIAYRKDTGEFMAVQEHYPHNTARWGGTRSVWLLPNKPSCYS